MSKTAFIFPGQGAQYVGMGQDFYHNYETARKVFECANRATGLKLEELCFQENEQLNITKYTQIAMLTTEVAILSVLQELGMEPDICAGLSLGEYGALAACKVFELEDLFRIIQKRGIYMQEAYPIGGAMTAVLGLDTETVCRICEQTEGVISVANYNCPGQIVITGEASAVQAASNKLHAEGARKCIPLNVSGPFHSILLKDAGRKLAMDLEKMELKNPIVPYVCNVDATCISTRTPIKELLEKQISSSVCWQQSVEKMIAEDVDTFIEIGPGKTLSGFVRKINKAVRVMNVDRLEDLSKLIVETAKSNTVSLQEGVVYAKE